MKGVITSTGATTFTPAHGKPYKIHCGVIGGEDGRDYAYTASECCRNGTHSGTLTVGADAWFGSIEDGCACWVSWRPIPERDAAAMESRHSKALDTPPK